MRALAVTLLTLAALPAAAAVLEEITVAHDDGRYVMRSVTWFDAPRIGVFDVLTDYDRFGRISSIYTKARFEPRRTGELPVVYTEVEGCVLFFCQTMERTETLETDGLDRIVATVIGDNRDFHASVATWELRERDGGTEVVYRIEMEPAFWVPPLIGPYVMKRKLRKGGADAIQRIERLAQASDADIDVFVARGLQGFDSRE